MRSKYGNTAVKLPETYLLEKEAVLKAETEGLIDRAEAQRRILKVQREANLFIVMTNGGYSMPTRRRRAQARKMMRVQRYLEQMKKMLEENEKAPDGEEIDTPQTQKPEPIDTPSRDPVKPVDPEEGLLAHLQPKIDAALAGSEDDGA